MARNILNRQQYKLEQKGFTPREALSLSASQQKKKGNLLPGQLRLSDRGRTWSNFSSEERAIMRRAMETKKNPSEYIYYNGRVLLKKNFRFNKF